MIQHANNWTNIIWTWQIIQLIAENRDIYSVVKSNLTAAELIELAYKDEWESYDPEVPNLIQFNKLTIMHMLLINALNSILAACTI